MRVAQDMLTSAEFRDWMVFLQIEANGEYETDEQAQTKAAAAIEAALRGIHTTTTDSG